MDIKLFVLIFCPLSPLFMGISHVPSTVLQKAFLSDPASSEKSRVQIIPLSLYFFKVNKNCFFPTFFERRKEKSFFFFSCSGFFSTSLYIKFPVDNSLVNWSLAEMERQNGFLSLEVENFSSKVLGGLLIVLGCFFLHFTHINVKLPSVEAFELRSFLMIRVNGYYSAILLSN